MAYLSSSATSTSKELSPRWNLTVKVLRAKFLKAYDYFNQNDLYVTLRLPTASARTLSTRCISNCNTPEWNEAFHFRVQSQVKNILELTVYDQDVLSDDLCTSFLFDISNLTLGQKDTKVFVADEQTKDELWVEFELTESTEPPEGYFSNGVLVAAPLSTLEVKINKLPSTVQQGLMLKLAGAYKEDQVISASKKSSLMQSVRYYVNKYLETEIKVVKEEEEDTDEASLCLASAPVSPFTSTQELSVPVEAEMVSLQLNMVDSPDEDLKVRLDFDIPAAEKAFLEKRREVAALALQKALKLKAPVNPNKAPVVAVVFSGGGSRAMTSMYGSLKGLQKLGLLDAVTYITAVSGSTWAMSQLYSDPSWSKADLDKSIAPVQKELSKSVSSLFTPTQLKYYYAEMRQKQSDGYSVSPIDMWGLTIEHLVFGKKHTATLSDQQRAVSEGQNPLPIYIAVNLKEDSGGSMVPEWCEFTPFEVGFSKYGAYVPSENFGSEFYLGHLVKKLPETRISYLLGMWSSIFSTNLSQLWSLATGLSPSWTPWLAERTNSIETDNKRSTLDTMRVSNEASTLNKFLTGRPFISHVFNFLRGFFLHNLYSENNEFNTSKDTHPDAFPNKLTPMDPNLGLVDAGFAINSGFPPVLRARRRADVILSFDYSWTDDRLKTLKQTQQYCAEHQIPFPKTDLSKLKSEPVREVYVFEDQDNPEAPIVIHLPLINVTYKEFKAPGVKRKGEKELKEGNVDVTSNCSPYITSNITFSPKDFQSLVDLNAYNVMNNKNVLVNTLEKVLSRKATG
ncbi:cytosolic phospholipase A2 zeta [Trichomycterus rosablanca]|uniref:cytosolic phospholipase A2 zeta n=1 Tax=Trichomycterus rosablanca TaxID=2290929 RepID=UPI002F3577D4